MALRRSSVIWVLVGATGILLLAASSLKSTTSITGCLPFPGVILISVAGIVLGARLVRVLTRRFFYRLSRRLAFSYFLIGIVPIPLLALLLAIVAYLTFGQFEAFRVRTALGNIGNQMASGQIPGALRASARKGKIISSNIPGLLPGQPTGDWIGKLTSPIFFGVREPDNFVVAAAKEGTTHLFALPRRGSIFLDSLARQSGVAILSTELTASRRNSESSPVTINLNSRTQPQVVAPAGDYVYPPEATAADRSASPFEAVTWVFLGRPVMVEKGSQNENNAVAFFITRMSWHRAASELFSQEVHLGGTRNWASIMLLVITVLAAALLGIYLIALFIAFILVASITRTVNRLSFATQKISTGDFSVRIATKARDQVGNLARSFDSMAESLAATVHERAARESLERDISQARQIVLRLLPATDAAVPGLNVTTYFEPVAEIGGDYYDFLTSRGGRTTIAVGDVSGHGLPTALLVATAKAAISTLLESGRNGSELFEQLNVLLHRSTATRDFMTLQLAAISGNSHLELTSAGHLPPYRISKEGVSTLELPAFPLGLFEDRRFPTKQFPFEPGDRLVFYTDGIVECRDSRDESFGFDRLAQVIRQNATAPLDNLKEAILAAIQQHCGEVPFDDDRTLVICERC